MRTCPDAASAKPASPRTIGAWPFVKRRSSPFPAPRPSIEPVHSSRQKFSKPPDKDHSNGFGSLAGPIQTTTIRLPITPLAALAACRDSSDASMRRTHTIVPPKCLAAFAQGVQLGRPATGGPELQQHATGPNPTDTPGDRTAIAMPLRTCLPSTWRGARPVPPQQ